MNTTINDTRLSPQFKLGEFINLGSTAHGQRLAPHLLESLRRSQA